VSIEIRKKDENCSTLKKIGEKTGKKIEIKKHPWRNRIIASNPLAAR